MWSEVVTAVWWSVLVGTVVYVWAYERGGAACIQTFIEMEADRARVERDAVAARERDAAARGLVDPRGRVPLLGWVAVVAGAPAEAADAATGDAGSERVAGGDETARPLSAGTVSDAQATELEAWWTKHEQGGRDAAAETDL